MHNKPKLVAILVALAVLVTVSPAPFVKKHGSINVPTTTQAQLAKEQALSKTQSFVGSADPTPRARVHHQESADDGATTAVARAQARISGKDKKNTLQVLKTAEQQVEDSHRSPLLGLIWVVVAGCFGYGAFFAIRRWADKNVPDPSTAQGKLF